MDSEQQAASGITASQADAGIGNEAAGLADVEASHIEAAITATASSTAAAAIGLAAPEIQEVAGSFLQHLTQELEAAGKAELAALFGRVGKLLHVAV